MSTTYGLHRAMLLNRNGTATLFEDRRRTFAELGRPGGPARRRAERAGRRQGDRVAVLSLNQDRYIELFLGVAWAGAVIVPLNIRWSALENEDALRDCRPKILFVDAAFAAMGLEIAERIGSLPVIYADEAPAPARRRCRTTTALLAAASPVADAEARDDELAGIFYTGGTTGRSKGVMLSHRNLMANARNMLAEGLGGQDTVHLNAAPMFHLANAAEMYVHFLAGGSQAVLRMFTPERLAQTIERFRVTDLLLVPTMIQMFVDDPSTTVTTCPRCGVIIYGASAISEALLERAMEKLPTTHSCRPTA